MSMTLNTRRLDDVAIIEADGVETVVEDFEGPFRWDVLRTATRNRDIVSQVSQGARRGGGAAQFGFRTGTSVPIRGMYATDPNIPLPAVASRRFLERTGAHLGSEVELVLGSLLVPLSIQGEVKLFPTMEDSAMGFLLVNQQHLYYFAGLTNQTAPSGPNEAWLKLSRDPLGVRVPESGQPAAGFDQERIRVPVIAALKFQEPVFSRNAARQTQGAHGRFSAGTGKSHPFHAGERLLDLFRERCFHFRRGAEARAGGALILHDLHCFRPGMPH
jgi:hypothetical protein